MTDSEETAIEAGPAVSIDDVAREAVGWILTGDDVDRADLGDCVLVNRRLPHAWYASATRIRFDPAASASAIERVRAWFASHGRSEFVWMLGPGHTPADLADRLASGGARPESEPLTAMVLDHEPPPGPPDVEVRPIKTYAEFVLAEEILTESFGFSEAEVAAEREAYGRAWEHWQTEPGRVFLLAWRNGRPIAEAGLAQTSVGPLVLSGGSTLPDERGHGAYRALVRFRWDEAVRRGAPALVVQASPMSRPILARCGFRPVGEIILLIDRAG